MLIFCFDFIEIALFPGIRRGSASKIRDKWNTFWSEDSIIFYYIHWIISVENDGAFVIATHCDPHCYIFFHGYVCTHSILITLNTCTCKSQTFMSCLRIFNMYIKETSPLLTKLCKIYACAWHLLPLIRNRSLSCYIYCDTEPQFSGLIHR
jgi:hypothetical protein